jgi:hypothetical protein
MTPTYLKQTSVFRFDQQDQLLLKYDNNDKEVLNNKQSDLRHHVERKFELETPKSNKTATAASKETFGKVESNGFNKLGSKRKAQSHVGMENRTKNNSSSKKPSLPSKQQQQQQRQQRQQQQRQVSLAFQRNPSFKHQISSVGLCMELLICFFCWCS